MDLPFVITLTGEYTLFLDINFIFCKSTNLFSQCNQFSSSTTSGFY